MQKLSTESSLRLHHRGFERSKVAHPVESAPSLELRFMNAEHFFQCQKLGCGVHPSSLVESPSRLLRELRERLRVVFENPRMSLFEALRARLRVSRMHGLRRRGGQRLRLVLTRTGSAGGHRGHTTKVTPFTFAV